MKTATAPAAPVANVPVPNIPRKKTIRKEQRIWKVIEDPSGDFLGSYFRGMDINFKPEKAHWPFGIKFQNQKTGVTKTWNGIGFYTHDPREKTI